MQATQEFNSERVESVKKILVDSCIGVIEGTRAVSEFTNKRDEVEERS